jgi:ABC-type sugar transport system substrate-binding protein
VKIVVINRRGAVSIKARIVTRADSLVQRRLVNQLVAGVNETAANFRALDKCWLDIENVSVISDNNEERIYLVVPNCNQVGWFEEVRKAAKEAAKHVGVETHITIVQADPGHPEPPDYQE